MPKSSTAGFADLLYVGAFGIDLARVATFLMVVPIKKNLPFCNN
jgi:hypothetical protein